MHQCLTNLRDPENKLRIKKPTDFVASDEILLKNLRPLWCDGKTHKHSHLEGTYKGHNKTHLARTWSWELASIIAAGVSEVVKRLQLKTYVMSAYPVLDRAREAAAQAAIRREARPIESSSDSSQTESGSDSDTSSSSDFRKLCRRTQRRRNGRS